jgi:DNA ligase (NAD+)
MNKKDQIHRLAELRKLVDYHRDLYHSKDAPEISDQAYDALLADLASLELSVEGKKTTSQVVGGAASEAFTKVKHKVPQWSFDNVFDWAELTAWEGRLLRYLDKEGRPLLKPSYVAEHKIDGLKLVLEYESGKLVRASTRGDGEVGEDVTHTAVTIESLPKVLKQSVDLICVGEVWLSQENFLKLNKAQEARGKETFANPRNAAAGSLRQLDPEVAKERRLSLFVYDIDLFDALDSGLTNPLTQQAELELLKSLGFPVNQNYAFCSDLKAVQKYYDKWKNKVDDLPYGVDGVVIKLNEVKYQKVAGYTAKSPRYGVAYKFPAVETTTVVEDIDLQVGRTGVVTPVAHLRPVFIDGSTVSRATLHNEDQIKRLDVRVGDTVILRKAGDVIPEVVMVLKELRPAKSAPFVFPSRVASCGGDGSIMRIPGEAAYRCVSLESDFLRRQKFYYFVSKKALNLDGVGPKIIDALLDHELISDIGDLFTLKSEDLLVMPGFKEKAAMNVVKAIEQGSQTELWRLIVALSIGNVGEETARLLSVKFKSIAKLRKASLDELVAIDGVGEVVAENIINWQKDKREQVLLDKILPHLKIQTIAVSGEAKLSGLSFVFTGTLESFGRSEAGEEVRQLGASVSSSVSKKTSYVVAGKEPGSKVEEAKKLGVKILTEAEFLDLIA